MSSSHVQTPAARQAASSQQATLDALAGIVRDHARRHLAAMAARMSGALVDQSGDGLEARDIYRRVKSARLLKDNTYAFVHVAAHAIDRAVRRELATLAPATSNAPAGPLGLVPLEDIDRRLVLVARARPFEIGHADALAALAVRLGMLLGRGVLRADGNPFRPDVFLGAIDEAWREFEPDAEAHDLVQPLLCPDIVFDFAPLFDDLVAALRQAGQPGPVAAYRIQKTDDTAAARAARATRRAALAEQLRRLFGDDGGDDGVPLIPDLPSLPVTAGGGWRPSAAAGFGMAPAAGQGGVARGGMPPGSAAAQGDRVSGVAGVPPAAGSNGMAAAVGVTGVPVPGAPATAVASAPGGQAAGPALPVQAAVPQGAPAAAGMPYAADPAAAGVPYAAAPAAAGVPYAADPAAAGVPYAAAHTAAGVPYAAASSSAGRIGAGPPAAVGIEAPAMGAQPAAGWIAAPGMGVQPAPGFAPASAASPSGWHAAVHGALAGQAGTAPLLDLLARIEPALAGAPTAADTGAAPSGPLSASDPLPASGPLPDNVFYLPRLRQTLPRGALPRADERTLDLLSRVFETVLLDDSIPAPTRALLQLLQVPVLKAALLDKDFFFEEAHPARRLVDLMSRAGWEGRQGDDDPLFQAMQRSVARAGAGRPDAFAGAVAELEAGIAADESAQQAALAAPVASALRQEKHDMAARQARDAVALRVRAGDVVDVVGGFLEQRWTTVLTFAYTIEDVRPGAVGNATRAMDDLIWSVKPKPTQEQRKTLIARLPRLLAALNKWLDAIKWQDAERLQFFARLAEYHASIVRAPIELAPERQLELAVEAARQDALRRVELENAAAEQAAARAAEVSVVDGLERGMWMEFREGDDARKVKLAWVSPLRTLFIFSGAGRQEAFSLPADALAAALHAGRARVLAIDGVVGQVLSEAMAQGAMNDPALAMRGAALP